MNHLQAGFARVNITPALGVNIAGYFIDRFADGVLDELEANALAVRCGEIRALLISVDHVGIFKETLAPIIAEITARTGVPEEAIFIHSIHTHQGAPFLDPESKDETVQEYILFLRRRLTMVAEMALDDLKPARMGRAVGTAPHIAFVRRYLMKDGSIRTNPGVNNPEIDRPAGVVDERVNVLRFDRENADTIVLANFGCHPDTIGGTKFSADWPGFFRRTFERAVDNTKCLFFNGAQGDVNHVNVQPNPGDLNDMKLDFDDVYRGYGHARHMGRVVAGAVLQVYDKVAYEDVDSIRCCKRYVDLPSNMPSPEELPEARRIDALHRAGRDSELPYTGMMLTTVVAEATRMLKLEHGPAVFTMPMTAIAFGSVAFFGVPGEPFTGVGLALKETEGYSMILPCCNTNAKEGYFPMRESYEEGGYEARSSRYKKGTAELIVEEGRKMLAELRGGNI